MQPKYQLTDPYAGATRYFDDSQPAGAGYKPTVADYITDSGKQSYASGLLDMVNRGLIAGTAGAPVDIANTLIGTRWPELQSEKPVMGSEWLGQKMEDYGIVSPVRRPIGEAVAGFADPETLGLAAAKLAALGKVAGAGHSLQALMAFHGTPHMFDKFNAKYIGTGEGAQAYGHGLYLAEHPNTAGTYARQDAEYARMMGHMDPKTEFAYDLFSKGLEEPEVLSNFAYRYGSDLSFDDAVKAIESAKKYHNTGYVYKTDIPDEWIPKMADWDVALNKQPKQVQKTAQKLFEEHIKTDAWREENGGVKFGQFHDYLREKMSSAGDKNASQTISKAFADAGVPGIKYHDAGSRSAKEGTRNFVIFPGMEQDVKILERNGQPIEQTLLNSEGRPVHHTEEGTKNFSDWFGNSKVVDEQGTPLVLYHGTNANFSVFKESKSGQAGRGIYLSPFSGEAGQYGQNRMSLYASLKNPVDIERKDIPMDVKSWRANLENMGNDGVIIRNSRGNIDEVVAFHPEQIKSATGNTGAFNPTNPSIVKAEGGPVNTDNDDYGQPFGDEIAKLYQGGSYAEGGEVHKYIVTSLTPIQKRILKEHHAELGDERSFDDWMSDSGIPAIIHGHATKSMDSFLTPEQRETLDQVNS